MDCQFNKCDNSVYLTDEEIKLLNRKNSPYSEYKDSDGNLHTVSWLQDDNWINRSDVIGLINSNGLPEVGEMFDDDGNPIDVNFVKNLEENRNISAIPKEVKKKYAVCVKRTVAMCSPIEEPFYSKPNDVYYNNNVSAELMPGDGVIILHTSADAKWLFALADFFSGWIHKETVAYCADRKEWEDALNPEKFLVVTGYKTVIDTVNTARGRFDEIAYMGMKLRLSDHVSDSVNGRSTYGAYVVKLPSKNDDGMFCYVDAVIAVSQDVNVGFLEITSSNIVEQALKFLGHTYGWGGSDGTNDCSGMVRQIYRCFGINLPRNTEEIIKVIGFKSLDFQDGMSETVRCRMLKDVPVGSMIFLQGGHIMIYFGMKGGVPCCISSCGLCAESNELTNGKMKFTAMNCVFVCKLDEIFKLNGKSWLENIIRVIEPLKQ